MIAENEWAERLGMTAAVRIDPATGLKAFATRAAKATDKIAGKGYSAIDDKDLKTLPPPPPGAVFDAEEQAKYREFKEARRGAADYMAMEGAFSKYLEDVYSAPPIARPALDDACEILIVGAGMAGLILWHKLRKAGFQDVRFCEKGGDVGGTCTGTAIPASPATSRATATCRSWRRWATSRR
ncbi:MAG: NAD(P)-binding protein [Alphaproteobacteria bacterium]